MDVDKSDNVWEENASIHNDGKGQVDNALVMPEELAVLSDEERAKLGRRSTMKLDAVIMPILVVMYILNYLDRQNIASARLANIEEDLNINDVEYQTSVSILFCSYSMPHPLSLVQHQ